MSDDHECSPSEEAMLLALFGNEDHEDHETKTRVAIDPQLVAIRDLARQQVYPAKPRLQSQARDRWHWLAPVCAAAAGLLAAHLLLPAASTSDTHQQGPPQLSLSITELDPVDAQRLHKLRDRLHHLRSQQATKDRAPNTLFQLTWPSNKRSGTSTRSDDFPFQ